MEKEKPTKAGIGKTLRSQFLTGLLIIVPLGASILILIWIFNAIDNILQPVINRIWGHDIVGVGFAVMIILIYLAGLVGRNVIGKRILQWGDSLLNRVPIFRFLYRSIRQIMTSFSAPDNSGFMQVVIVDFPNKGMKTLGFITNEIFDKNGKKSLSIFIPHAPNPMTGFLQIYNDADVTRTKITVDEAMKWVVSVGRVMPGDIQHQI